MASSSKASRTSFLSRILMCRHAKGALLKPKWKGEGASGVTAPFSKRLIPCITGAATSSRRSSLMWTTSYSECLPLDYHLQGIRYFIAALMQLFFTINCHSKRHWWLWQRVTRPKVETWISPWPIMISTYADSKRSLLNQSSIVEQGLTNLCSAKSANVFSFIRWFTTAVLLPFGITLLSS